MKQIDYLKLVATGRKSSYYARPSEADEALKSLIGYGAVATWIVTFIVAFVVSYFGTELSMTTVARPMATLTIISLLMLIAGLFIGGAPTGIRVLMAILGASTSIFVLFLGVQGILEAWYLFIPLFVFFTLASSAAIRQLQ